MRVILLAVSLILAGCASEPPQKTTDEPNAGRYQIDNDIAPDMPISVEHIEDAHPRYEPKSLYGNKDYTLLGKDYPIVKEPKGHVNRYLDLQVVALYVSGLLPSRH